MHSALAATGTTQAIDLIGTIARPRTPITDIEGDRQAPREAREHLERRLNGR